MKEESVEGATLKEMMELSRELATNPKLREEVEKEIRSRIDPKDYFYIDSTGCGHFSTGSIHITSLESKDGGDDAKKV